MGIYKCKLCREKGFNRVEIREHLTQKHKPEIRRQVRESKDKSLADFYEEE